MNVNDLNLTAFETSYGTTYIRLDHLVSVSPSFQKPGHQPARAVSLLGNHKVYVTDSAENVALLLTPAQIADEKAARDAAGQPVTAGAKKRSRAPRLVKKPGGTS